MIATLLYALLAAVPVTSAPQRPVPAVSPALSV